MCLPRCAAVLAATFMLCLVSVPSIRAQETCYACPGSSTEQTVNVNICIGSTTYNVNVTYCTQTYSPTSATGPCADINNKIDAATSIRKICPGSTGLPTDIEKTVRAVYCAFSPVGQNIFGITIPNCSDRYCWTVRTPKCWQISQGCFVPCDQSICCSTQWRFCKDPMTGAVQCTRVLNCSSVSDCPQGCTQINCDDLPFCSCPSCF